MAFILQQESREKARQTNLFCLCSAHITQNQYSTKKVQHTLSLLYNYESQMQSLDYYHLLYLNSKAKQTLFANFDNSATVRMTGKTFNWTDIPWPNKSSNKETLQTVHSCRKCTVVYRPVHNKIINWKI